MQSVRRGWRILNNEENNIEKDVNYAMRRKGHLRAAITEA